MTERNASGTEHHVVCPFVAFDDDRDFRSEMPDHRHRCFAERPAASRALAHQAAYCLSSAFPGCPTFTDWARREAAPPREPPVPTLREAPTAPRQAERPTQSAGRPAVPKVPPPSPPRRGRAEWTAPPPWAAGAAASGPAGPAGDLRPAAGRARFTEPEMAPAELDEDEHPGMGAWTGSALGALGAAGPAITGAAAAGRATAGPADDTPRRLPEPVADLELEAAFAPPEPAAPPFLAGRAARSRDVERTPYQPGTRDASRDMPRAVPPRRGAVGYTPGDPTRQHVAGRGRDRDGGVDRMPARTADRGSERAVVDPAAPSWERPRRFEAYPSLKSGGGGLASLPRPALYGLIILVAAVALFAAPFVLRGLTGGDGGAASSPTPAPRASPGASAAPSVTPVPSPSHTVYTVKAGDTLSRIAAKFGLTVDQIVKANPQIKDPNKLGLGDQLVIPPTVAPAITDSGTLTPAPSPAATSASP